MNDIDDNNKTLNKIKPPTPLARLVQSFAKKISTLLAFITDLLTGGSIFFAKTLQFLQHTAFLMLKVLLWRFSFYSYPASSFKSYKKISTNPFLINKIPHPLYFYPENKSKRQCAACVLIQKV